MDTFVTMISDLIIMLFDLALYMRLTPLKKENRFYRGCMYGGVIVIAAAYVFAAYVCHVPYSIATVLCMSIPSFLLFFCLSKYKNARFLVTFCFVDTVTFIIAFCGKIAFILENSTGGIISCIVLLILSISTYLALRPYYPKYRELMERVAKGWTPMAVSAVFIYILLVFSAAYPTPIITRLEYLPVYMVLCVTILSFYSVFIVLIMQKAKLTRANLLLQQQQHWHDLAYLDELTKLANPAAYAARAEELERAEIHGQPIALMVFDIDDFKAVNDTCGHLAGNEVLKKTANFFLTDFPEKHYEFFRIGGDEFAAIVTGVSEDEIICQTEKINTMEKKPALGCTYSCGCAMVDFSQEHAFEKAFEKADRAMYVCKTAKKASK